MLAPSLTGYALTNRFRKLRARWAFTHLEAYLFFELVAACNDVDWASEFSLSNPQLCAALGCSEKGLISARKTLEDAGLICFVTGQNRKPTLYRFCASEGLPEVSVAAAKPLPEGLPQVRVEGEETGKGLPKGLPEGLPEVSPFFKQTKTKTKGALSADAEKNPAGKKPRAGAVTAEEIAALPLPHPGTEFATLWAMFRSGPKQAGKTRNAFELMLAKLGRRPEAFAVVMLEAAIQGNWSGIENPGTDRAFAEWQATHAASPTPMAGPAHTPEPELNHDFIAEQAAERQRQRTARLSAYAQPTPACA